MTGCCARSADGPSFLSDGDACVRRDEWAAGARRLQHRLSSSGARARLRGCLLAAAGLARGLNISEPPPPPANKLRPTRAPLALAAVWRSDRRLPAAPRRNCDLPALRPSTVRPRLLHGDVGYCLSVAETGRRNCAAVWAPLQHFVQGSGSLLVSSICMPADSESQNSTPSMMARSRSSVAVDDTPSSFSIASTDECQTKVSACQQYLAAS